MTVHNDLFTLSNVTATRVVPVDRMVQEVHLHNQTKSSNEYIFLGNENITVTNSMHIDPGESKILFVVPGDELFAVSDPNGLKLGVLRITKD